jgi:hypothetical protein
LALAPEQHEHPGPCDDLLGLSALRSFVSCARRLALDITARRGTFIITRGAVCAQVGQSQGSLKFCNEAKAVKGPQSSQ